MTTEISIPPRYPLPDPADRPMLQAAASMAHCASTKENPVAMDIAMRELRGAMAELSPGGHYRTPDIMLASQMSVLNSMFHIAIRDAVRPRRICVEDPSLENGFKGRYEDGDPYLRSDDTLLALKVGTQCRRIIEGLKSADDKGKRTRLARRRQKIQEKNKKS